MGDLFHKKPNLETLEFNTAISPDFLSLLPPPMPLNFVAPETVVEVEPVHSVLAAVDANMNVNCQTSPVLRDYEGVTADDSSINSVGMVHLNFLHSNATSHKWALGAFAELLDNFLDEVCNGATYANVDMMKNKKDGSHMLKTDSRISDKEKPSPPSKPASAKKDSTASDKDKCSPPSNPKTKPLTELDKRTTESDNTSEDGSCYEPSRVIGQSQTPRLHLHETSPHIPRRSRLKNSQAAAVHEDGPILYNGNAESSIKSKGNDGRVLPNGGSERLIKSQEKDGRTISNGDTASLTTSKEEDHKSSERSERVDDLLSDLQYEREKCTSLENQGDFPFTLQKAQQKIEEIDEEQVALIDIIQEERVRRDAEEDRLREKLKEASSAINNVLEKIKWLEERRTP